LARLGRDARALKLLREVADANPLRPEPYLQGLEIAKRSGDVEGVRWAVSHILGRAWPKEQQHVVTDARRLAEATLTKLLETDPTAAEDFRESMQQAIRRDVSVKLSWTGNADIDVIVEEPSGTVCSLRNQRTTAGGILLGDGFSHASQPAEGVSEAYVCPEGFSGRYRVLVRRVWGRVAGDKVTVDIYLRQNTPEQEHIHRQIPLGDQDALVVFDLAEGRRKESLRDHQVATVVSAQAAINRSVLAQNLNSMSESEAVTNFAIARNRLLQGNPLFPGAFRGAVGYQPQITLLPEGAMLIGATAVVSADRRYVRFSGLPFFSVIGEVQTFNFATGNTGTSGGGGTGTGTGTTGIGGFGGIGGGF
jgi:hypothetical protein